MTLVFIFDQSLFQLGMTVLMDECACLFFVHMFVATSSVSAKS